MALLRPFSESQMIFLDNHSTTPCDPRVLEKMLPFFCDSYGNASSAHVAGLAAHRAVVEARSSVAELIGARADEIVFTGGATESINLALKSCLRPGSHLVTLATEHRAVLDTSRYLAASGIEVTVLPVDSEGLVQPEEVANALKSNTVLVSVMHANNEIGVLQPIGAISSVCRDAGVLFHTDASQSLGKVPVDVDADGVDLLSGTAHKFYGPKGTGFLYVRRRHAGKLRSSPQMHGGGHEGGARSGTLNVPGIVGLGEAARISRVEMIDDGLRIGELSRSLLGDLMRSLPGIRLNGHRTMRLPGNLNVAIPGVSAQALAEYLDGLCLSTGSACSSQSVEPSHVLLALGLSEQEAYSSIRIGIGRFNQPDDIAEAVRRITEAVHNLRAIV